MIVIYETQIIFSATRKASNGDGAKFMQAKNRIIKAKTNKNDTIVFLFFANISTVKTFTSFL